MERKIWKCLNFTEKKAYKAFLVVNQIQTLSPRKSLRQLHFFPSQTSPFK